MSCSNQNLRNLDTTVYRSGRCGCTNDDCNVTIQFIDRGMPMFPCHGIRPPFPPMPPMPVPPITPPQPTPGATVGDYALFYNTAATGATYAAGTTIPFPSTLYNTGIPDITNNNGSITLSGGTTGRAYLVSYQVSGIFTDATLGLTVNAVNDTSTNSFATGAGEQTVGGSYIVAVPANTVSIVALNVIAGSVTTPTPTSGTNISVVRIS